MEIPQISSKLVYTVISIMSVIVIAQLGIYFWNFHGDFGSQSEFGEFGDFFGGVLNPFISLTTFGAVAYSLLVQIGEIKKRDDENTNKEFVEFYNTTLHSIEQRANNFEYDPLTSRVDYPKKPRIHRGVHGITMFSLRFVDWLDSAGGNSTYHALKHPEFGIIMSIALDFERLYNYIVHHKSVNVQTKSHYLDNLKQYYAAIFTAAILPYACYSGSKNPIWQKLWSIHMLVYDPKYWELPDVDGN